jgi:hypothetical protein
MELGLEMLPGSTAWAKFSDLQRPVLEDFGLSQEQLKISLMQRPFHSNNCPQQIVCKLRNINSRVRVRMAIRRE